MRIATILLWALAAFAGCSERGKGEPASARAAAPAQVTCLEAADNLTRLTRRDVDTPAVRAKVDPEAVLSGVRDGAKQACEVFAWPADVRACVARARSGHELDSCHADMGDEGAPVESAHEPEPPAVIGPPIGIAECDDYRAAVLQTEGCVELNPEAGAALRRSYARLEEHYKQLDDQVVKKVVIRKCKEGLQMFKASPILASCLTGSRSAPQSR